MDPAATGLFEAFTAERGARLLDRDDECVTVELAGSEREVDAFLAGLPPGVALLAVVRSGPLVTARGAAALT